ncbi:hypothetical protein RRG08_024115 [Elysia crispata]|uniref:Uncharacterized protein n=1 Tax=Elysia crispata TaxID=231223 RepID=A0AAE0ZQC3_9GAST|nr:hypothetical protein RRG08_024115 [Elysia crispata]
MDLFVINYVLMESLEKNVFKTAVATVEEQINCVTTLMVTAPMDVSVVSRVTNVRKNVTLGNMDLDVY